MYMVCAHPTTTTTTIVTDLASSVIHVQNALATNASAANMSGDQLRAYEVVDSIGTTST